MIESAKPNGTGTGTIRMSMDVGARIMIVDENGDYAGVRVIYPDWYYELLKKQEDGQCSN